MAGATAADMTVRATSLLRRRVDQYTLISLAAVPWRAGGQALRYKSKKAAKMAALLTHINFSLTTELSSHVTLNDYVSSRSE
jgi:hypothetical protein